MFTIIQRLILTSLLSCLFFSCGEDSALDESGVSMKQQVIAALNTDQADKALGMAIAGEHSFPGDPEFTYYKAQAYSLKAEIDIYTLFPIVQMQIFDVAINEWNKANEFEKRRRDSVNISILGEENRDSKFETDEIIRAEIKRLEDMTPEQVSQVSIVYEVTYTYGYSGYSYDGQPSDETNCYATFIVTSKEIPSGRSPYRNYVNYKKGEKTCEEEASLHIEPLIPTMKQSLHRYAISYHEEKLKKLTNRRGQERYIKSALALFDSIPILKKIPVIKEANFDDLYKALDILTSLHSTLPKDTRIWNNVFQQVGLLGGYLVTYSIKDAIDLEGVKSPYDLICKVNASKLISNYRHLLTGGKALLNVTLESDFYEKNKDNMDKALEYIKLAPDSISDEQKEEFIDNIMDFQEDNC